MERFEVKAYNGTTLVISASNAMVAGDLFLERTKLHATDIKSIVNVR